METLRYTYSLRVLQTGNPHEAWYVLRWYGDLKHWTKETFQSRWDGAAALLNWWHSLEPKARPPLDNLSPEDARAFLLSLATRSLSRSTIKGYRAGASALTKALRAGKHKVHSFDSTYDPFKGIQPAPMPRPAVPVNLSHLEALEDPRAKARLRALTALLKLGLTVPEACSRRWDDVSFKLETVYDYKRRPIALNAEALNALLELARTYKQGHPRSGALGWQAATARRWLKKVVEKAE